MSWRVAKALLHLREQVNAKYPHRNRENDGTIGDEAHASRTSDHNPWVTDGGEGVVTAMDITHDPARGLDSYKMADELKVSGDKRIKYVISNRRIWNPAVGSAWRQYNGSNPHDHHVHVSVKPAKTLYDDVHDWSILMLAGQQATPTTAFTEEVNHEFHEHITATEFGGKGDPNSSFYDGHVITDTEVGVALPYKFKGVRPKVRVMGPGGTEVGIIVDLGPWDENDPYWLKNARPHAESGTDERGRTTNLAGIDLTPAMARAVGIQGKGFVNWEFVDPAQEPEHQPTPTVAYPRGVGVPTAHRAKVQVSSTTIAKDFPVLPGSKFIADIIRDILALFGRKS